MNHLVLGSEGNLGHDLTNALAAKGHTLCSSIQNVKYPHKGQFLSMVSDRNPDVIWNCIGAGSVGGKFHDQLQAHVNMVVQMHEMLPKATIINFSTSFVASRYNVKDPFDQERPQRSLYALSKAMMEDYIKFVNKPNLKAIRVTNLYGAYRPDKCFPGKIKTGNVNMLPVNRVTPTPTDALALKLVQHMNTLLSSPNSILNATPTGSCTVADWGRIINPTILDGAVDSSRPLYCELGSFFPWSSWDTLWLEFNQRHNNIYTR